MNQPVRPELSPTLKASVRDAKASALMIGFGETYLSPFLIFLGASPIQIGLSASLPPFVGALGQLFGVRLLRHSIGRKKIIVVGAAITTFCWLLFSLLATAPRLLDAGPAELLPFLVIGISILYYAASGALSPSWNSLLGDVVPQEIRGWFFGVRSRSIAMFTFLGLFLGGFVLEIGRQRQLEFLGFVVVFFLATVSRAVSTRALRAHEDPPFAFPKREYFSFWQFIRRAPHSNFAKFVIFVAIVNFAISISGPFFSLYMLRDMQLSYSTFAIISAVAALAQFIFMKGWGKVVDRVGSKSIMNFCGVGIAFSPMLWLFSRNIWWLLAAQAYGGFIWAGFNLAALTFLFDAVTPAKRGLCAAYQACITNVLVVCGALLGGFLVTHVPARIQLGDFSAEMFSGLQWIFLLSGSIRLVAAAILLPTFKEVRPVEKLGHTELFMEVTHLRPISGMTFALLTGLKKQKGK